MQSENYIGIMSGTSMDGVDVVLCRVDEERCDLLSSIELSFPKDLKERLLEMISGKTTLKEIGEINHRLGKLFSQAVQRVLKDASISSSEVVAVGLHGQTLWHQPEGAHPFTMQLGDPAVVAAHTGITVVADFRSMDVAFGGSGAPLAPVFHDFIFKHEQKRTAVVNIGGIANISCLDDPVIGYDTGPGNLLMDAWCMHHLGQAYDKDGQWARQGSIDQGLLESMLCDPYFSREIPKSTGREHFNMEWLHNLLDAQHATLNASDIQRTLLELTARSISNEVLRHHPDILMLCGGGAKNSFLLERMADLMPIQVAVMEHSDWIEAMMMAWLAYKRIHGKTVKIKEITGARENAVAGAVYMI